nr:GNAT family N-acetyltransferase [Sedimentibacter sp.]
MFRKYYVGAIALKIIVDTNRLLIREFIRQDAEDLYKLESDSRVIEYIPGSRLLSLNECRREIKKYINNYKTNNLSRWPVFLKSTNEFIGVTGFRYLPSLKKTEIGTKLIPSFWGNGYSTELGNAIINYGLIKMKLNEIIAMADPENIKSIKSLESLGMKFVKYGYYNGNRVAYYNIYK